jgi:large subunit ribosomal protein L13
MRFNRGYAAAEIMSNTSEAKWVLVDAEGCTLGRLSTMVAMRLMGKHRADYAPHVNSGDHVVVVNAGKIVVTGRKLDQKVYRWYSGYPGGLKELPLRRAIKSHPERVIEWAVQGMLPKSKLGNRLIRNLKVYAGAQHPHEAQRPESLAADDARKLA